VNHSFTLSSGETRKTTQQIERFQAVVFRHFYSFFFRCHKNIVHLEHKTSIRLMWENEHAAPSFIAWISFACIALVHQRMMKHCRVIKNSKYEHSTSSTKKLAGHQDVWSENEIDTEQNRTQFPWEPQNHADQASMNLSGVRITKQDRTEKQSEFLSIMTFANQNLRPPSCPCCR
jgi:hypothetical protein